MAGFYLEWMPAPGRARRSTCRGLRPGAPDREDLLSALSADPCHSSAPCALDLGRLRGRMETVREHAPMSRD